MKAGEQHKVGGERGDWLWRCRLFEGCEVLTAGTKVLSRKTRRKASRVLRPFLRAVEAQTIRLTCAGAGDSLLGGIMVMLT